MQLKPRTMNLRLAEQHLLQGTGHTYVLTEVNEVPGLGEQCLRCGTEQVEVDMTIVLGNGDTVRNEVCKLCLVTMPGDMDADVSMIVADVVPGAVLREVI